MLTFTSKLSICLACLVAVLSVPPLGAGWFVLLATHAVTDGLWWLLLGVWFWATLLVFELWRGMWRFLDPEAADVSWFEVVADRQRQAEYWDLHRRVTTATSLYAAAVEERRRQRLELLADKPVVAALKDMGDMADLVWL